MKFINEEKVERNQAVTCEKCKNKYTIQASDLTQIAHHESYKLYSFNCPHCGARDYIKNTQLSFQI